MRALALCLAVQPAQPERQLRALSVGAKGELAEDAPAPGDGGPGDGGPAPAPADRGLSDAARAINSLDGDDYLPTPVPSPQPTGRAPPESLLHSEDAMHSAELKSAHHSLAHRLKLWSSFSFGGSPVGEYDIKTGMNCGFADHGELPPAFETSLKDCKALCDKEALCCGFGHSSVLDGICARKVNCGVCEAWGGDAAGDFYVKKAGPPAYTKTAQFPVSDAEADQIRLRLLPKLNVKVPSRRRFAKSGDAAPRPGSFSWFSQGDGKSGAWSTLSDFDKTAWYGSKEEHEYAIDGEVPHEGPDAQPYDEWAWYWEPNDAEPWQFTGVGRDRPEEELARHLLFSHGMAVLVSMGKSQLVGRDSSCEARGENFAGCSLGGYWCGKLAEAGLDASQAARVTFDKDVSAGQWLIDGQPSGVGAGKHGDPCPGDSGATICGGSKTFGWGAQQAAALAHAMPPAANELSPSDATCKKLEEELKLQTMPGSGCQDIGGQWQRTGGGMGSVPVTLAQRGCTGTNDQRYEYVGCFVGSSTVDRPGGDVPITQNGVELCRDRCARRGYEYFGFECPMGDKVHCECGSGSGNLEGQQDHAQCKQANPGGGQHCTGPFIVTGALGEFFMGSGGVNALYKVAEGTLDYTVRGSVVTKGNLVSGQVSEDGMRIDWSNGWRYTRSGGKSHYLAKTKVGTCMLETPDHPDATACEWFCHETAGCKYFSFIPGEQKRFSPKYGVETNKERAAECRLFSGCDHVGRGGDPNRPNKQALFTTTTDPLVPRGGAVSAVEAVAEDQCVDQKHALRQFDDSSVCAKHTTAHKCAAAGPPCFFQTGAERVMRSLHDSFVEALRTELLWLRQSALENLHSWDHAAEWRSRKAYAGYRRDHQEALEAYDRVVFDVQAEHSPQVREFLSLYLPPPDKSLRVDLYQKGQLDADKYGKWLSRTRDFPLLPLPPAENEQESKEWYPTFVANWSVFQKGLIPDGPRAGTRAELRNLELVNATCESSGAGGWIAFQAHWAIENHGLDLGDEDLCCVHVLAQDCSKVHKSWNDDGRLMGRYLKAWYENSADVYAWSKEWQDRQSRSAAELMEFTKSAYATAGYPVQKAPFEKWWDETWFKENDERWAFPGTTG